MKILIISYLFLQTEKIGSIRIQGLAKYLHRCGYQPTVITAKTDSNQNFPFRIIETDYEDLMAIWKKKLNFSPNKTINQQIKIKNNKNTNKLTEHIFKIWNNIIAYPDLEKNWYKPAIEAGSKILENESFDAIISSSSPVTCHLVAQKLKKDHNIPWIADLRDLWTQNPYMDHFFLRDYFEKRLELKTLRYADIITTVSKPLALELKKIHENKEIFSISNGFDPDIQSKTKKLDQKLTITYTGNLYHGKRDPKKLFIALNELISEKKINVKDLSINFYGPKEDWLINDIQKYNLSKVVNLIGIIPRKDVLKIQRKSQLLLLLTWENPKEYGIVPGKVFEYLAAQRPIISIGFDKGPLQDIIKSTNSGIHTSEIKEIKKFIHISYNQFKSDGLLQYYGIKEEVNKYNQIEMCKKFIEILNKIVD